MLAKVVSLHDNIRFHARPAGQVAKVAQKYESLILILCDDQVIDAKKVISLMNASPFLKNQLELIIDGEDELEAMNEMEKILHELIEY